jgi:hypothetical protein
VGDRDDGCNVTDLREEQWRGGVSSH